jgi:phosphoglycerate dehydrogenase-like enzyme
VRELDRLAALPGVEVRVAPGVEDSETERELPPDLIREAELLLCTYLPVNHGQMTRLRLVQISSAGYTQLAGLGLPARGVRACNGLGIFDAPIAEWCAAMMVNLARNLRGMIRHQDAGAWDRGAEFQGEVRGRTVGFWGYGGIARATARLARGMGARIHALTRGGVRPRVNTYCVEGAGDPGGTLVDRAFRMEEKEAFLRSVDFLILAMPLTRANEGVVGEAELRMLKPGAFLLNPARGPLVEEAALLRALREGWIAGAALDTHYQYPMPADHPLWRFANVIMTPHISGASGGPYYRERVGDLFVQNAERFLANRPLLNELTAEQLGEP